MKRLSIAVFLFSFIISVAYAQQNDPFARMTPAQHLKTAQKMLEGYNSQKATSKFSALKIDIVRKHLSAIKQSDAEYKDVPKYLKIVNDLEMKLKKEGIKKRQTAAKIISKQLWDRGIVCLATLSGQDDTTITFHISGYDIDSAYHLSKDSNLTSTLSREGFKKAIIRDGNGNFLKDMVLE
ncbi:MAG: hypothetical protein ABSB32_00340 [Thermodesulfobacteriota bacterium]